MAKGVKQPKKWWFFNDFHWLYLIFSFFLVIPSSLSMKQDSLFCFGRLRSPKPWCFMLHPWYLWKALDEWGVHRFGLRLFGAMMWKLSMIIIESFSQWKLYKIKSENRIGIRKHSWCCWKAFGKSDLIKCVTIVRAKVCKILMFEWILLLEVQKNYKKLGLEGKIS
jgi:hypothetical protein